MVICTRRAQAAAEAAEIRTAQRMVVDAVLVVEAGVGHHLMFSRRHRPRWRASQRGRWRRQWWRGAPRYGAEAEQEVVDRRAACAGSSVHVAGGGRARAELLRRGAAGRGGSPGEAARLWLRLRPRERGGGGAEARAGGRAAAAQLSAPARAMHSGAAVQRTRGGLVCRRRPTAALPPNPLPSPCRATIGCTPLPTCRPYPGTRRRPLQECRTAFGSRSG
jgi:hypothetical protein